VPDLTRRDFPFHSEAVADGDLVVSAFTGRDRIGRPFRFELELASERADIDGTALLTNDAWFGLKQGTMLASGQVGARLLKFHGVLSRFEQLGRKDGWYLYHAILVPKLWRLSLTRQSRIFQEQSTIDIITDVLEAAGFGDDDFEFRANARSYPEKEYLVQYQETDLDFINRLTEMEGISYFFENSDDACCVVFADQAEGFKDIPGAVTSLPFRESSDARVGQNTDDAVYKLTTRYQAVTGNVVLGDFDYNQPAQKLLVEAEVDGDATFGLTHEHGGNVFTENDLGDTIAKIRAEEISCRKQLFIGRGDARGLRAGAVFTLSGHFNKDCNIKQLLTEVTHKGSQTIDSGDDGGEGPGQYRCKFLSIPAEVPFRPLRTTPRPVIQGTIHAIIDAAGSGQYAELDDQGCYRVRIPFDRRTDAEPAKASAPVRMIQPYGGDTMGMHSPLHKGTEVMLTHIDGDPDRPVIAGAVPNPETTSMVVDKNQTQSIWRSAGQNSIVFEDSKDAEQIIIDATKDVLTTIGNNELHNVTTDQTIDVGGNASLTIDGNQTITVTGTQTESVSGNRTISAKANETHAIGANLTETVGANLTETIGANHATTVAADDNLGVGGARVVTVTGNDLLQANNILLNGKTSITLKVGGNLLVIDSSGITLKANNITLKASSAIKFDGSTVDSDASGAHTTNGGTVTSTASSGANTVGGAGVTISGGSGKVSITGSSVENNS
jgi:type VI secretion system secreted protein VgrG